MRKAYLLLLFPISLFGQPQPEVKAPEIFINLVPAEIYYDVEYENLLSKLSTDTLTVVVDTMLIDVRDLKFLNPGSLADTLFSLIMVGEISPNKARVVQYTRNGKIRSILTRRGRSDVYDIDENRGNGFVRLLQPHRDKFNKFLTRGKSLKKSKKGKK